MRIARPCPADLERWARAEARRRRRDETVAAGALRRAQGIHRRPRPRTLRAEAGAQRAEADRLSTNCLDGSDGAWRAAKRRDRAADLLDPGGGS